MKYLLIIVITSLSLNLFALWQETQEIFASDGGYNAKFGSSVSVSDNYAVIGAPQLGSYGITYGPGAAYVFYRNGDTWEEQIKLTASDGSNGDLFGFSVAIDGDNIIIGAYGDGDDGEYSGSAYIFNFTGTTWVEQVKLTASDASSGDSFGTSVAIHGDYVIIGAQGDDDSFINSGSAYIFNNNGTTWSEQAKLTASSAYVNNLFGCSVSIDNDLALVGARQRRIGWDYKGSAYVFERNGSDWNEVTELIASNAQEDDNMGCSVSIDGNYAISGAYGKNSSEGAAYIFYYDGNTWSQQAILTASDGNESDRFGYSVSIKNNTVLIGAYYVNSNGSRSGAAYIFDRDGTNWNEKIKIVASDGMADDRFGASVSLSENSAIVGAIEDDDNGNNSGAAYIFQDAPPPAPVNVQLSISGNDIVLSWDANGSTSYNIYRSTDPENSDWGSPIGNTISNSYTDFDAALETKYFYYVTSIE